MPVLVFCALWTLASATGALAVDFRHEKDHLLCSFAPFTLTIWQGGGTGELKMRSAETGNQQTLLAAIYPTVRDENWQELLRFETANSQPMVVAAGALSAVTVGSRWGWRERPAALEYRQTVEFFSHRHVRVRAEWEVLALCRLARLGLQVALPTGAYAGTRYYLTTEENGEIHHPIRRFPAYMQESAALCRGFGSVQVEMQRGLLITLTANTSQTLLEDGRHWGHNAFWLTIEATQQRQLFWGQRFTVTADILLPAREEAEE